MSVIESETPDSHKDLAPPPDIAPGDFRLALLAAFAGWLFDAFNFFLVVYCLTSIGKEFQKSDASIALSITVTLAFRPVGALLVGFWADRCGRRWPFMANVLFYSFVGALTGLAHSYMAFMILRALFGIGMGGQWGVSVSLAMEKVPIRKRGIYSGLLQQGWAAGSILAALCYLFLFGRWGWRPLFLVGNLPALLLLPIMYYVKESEVWEKSKQHSWQDLKCDIRSHWKLFLYMTALLTMMNVAAHGTQDMYPTFLQRQWHFSADQRSGIAAFSMVGAIVGGIAIGRLSDLWGRRRATTIALLLAILAIPVWAYSHSPLLLVLGAFLIQFMVMGAWGVMPAHLAELSPDSVRALLPGFAYQFGALLSSAVVYVEAAFAQGASYSTAMALVALSSCVLASIMAAVGPERWGADLGVG
jgi:MFS transporter, SHS family, lactate transporter